MQHNQCPCRSFNRSRENLIDARTSYVVTKLPGTPQRYHGTLLRTRYIPGTRVCIYAVSTVDNAMPCHHTGYVSHDVQCGHVVVSFATFVVYAWLNHVNDLFLPTP